MNPLTNPLHPLNPISPIYVFKDHGESVASANAPPDMPIEFAFAIVVVTIVLTVWALAAIYWTNR